MLLEDRPDLRHLVDNNDDWLHVVWSVLMTQLKARTQRVCLRSFPSQKHARCSGMHTLLTVPVMHCADAVPWSAGRAWWSRGRPRAERDGDRHDLLPVNPSGICEGEQALTELCAPYGG